MEPGVFVWLKEVMVTPRTGVVLTEDKFQVVYIGGTADQGLLDFYDGSTSYRGLARTLALLGHYYGTGEIISKAPFSKADLYLLPPEEGSFKQTVLVSIATAVITVPFTVFTQEAIQSWFPSSDPQLQVLIDATRAQNEILEAQLSDTERANLYAQRTAAKAEVAKRKDEIDVIRSITAESFKSIFRPVGRSVSNMVISAGKENAPIGAVSPFTVGLIDSDTRNPARVGLVGTVTAFSRNSKTGVIFSEEIGRGFRFEFMGAERLKKEDVFSWSQFRQAKIYVEGEWVYFFDGTIKKFLVYHAAPVEDEASEVVPANI